MINILINSYKEPKATERAIKAFLVQNIPKPFKLIVIDPFLEMKQFIKEKFQHHKEVEFYLDPGEGKSTALNMVLEEIYTDNKEDIIISTDGDVYVSNNTIKEILNSFKDPKIGLVCCRPVSLNSRKNKFGYWSHLLFDEMNKTRKKLSKKQEFFEVSGYLFAMRNGVIKEFMVDACEDTVISDLFWKKGYKIAYNENAQSYVLNPQNFKDWVTQKKRNVKGHISLQKKSKGIKRKTTFFQEVFRGLYVFIYPRNLIEFLWSINLLFARLYLWIAAWYDIKIKKDYYRDGWREIETPTTKPLD